MAYTYLTFGQMKQQLFDRLGDSIFWTNSGSYPEVGLYLTEALRVWAAASHYWKERIKFATAADVAWYDLPSTVGVMAYTVTDQQVAAEIQYHLLEPVDPVTWTWTGTDMFTMDEVAGAIRRRRDQFLVETGTVINRNVLTVAPPPAEGRFVFPNNIPEVIDVRRVSWVDVNQAHHHLWRSDDWAATSAIPEWNINPALPAAYAVVAVPPLQIQFIPPPNDVGQIDLLSTNRGPALDLSVGIALGVPDNLAWVIKWGAMADLLGKQGQANDPERAAYCERRWREGVEIARLYSSALAASINDVPVTIESLHNLDAYRPTWEDETHTKPDTITLAGLNLAALASPPDAQYGIAMDVLRPAVIPSNDATFVQLGPEELNVVLDYALHIASFKQGGVEFNSTVRNYENFLRLAAVHNDRIRASAIFGKVLYDRANIEEYERPRRLPKQGSGNILTI